MMIHLAMLIVLTVLSSTLRREECTVTIKKVSVQEVEQP